MTVAWHCSRVCKVAVRSSAFSNKQRRSPAATSCHRWQQPRPSSSRALVALPPCRPAGKRTRSSRGRTERFGEVHCRLGGQLGTAGRWRITGASRAAATPSHRKFHARARCPNGDRVRRRRFGSLATVGTDDRLGGTAERRRLFRRFPNPGDRNVSHAPYIGCLVRWKYGVLSRWPLRRVFVCKDHRPVLSL